MEKTSESLRGPARGGGQGGVERVRERRESRGGAERPGRVEESQGGLGRVRECSEVQGVLERVRVSEGCGGTGSVTEGLGWLETTRED